MALKTVVLVVEDQAVIRIGAVQMLEEAGFEVVEAGNAHDAVSILEGRTDICAIFTDIKMPGTMDGMRLARMVRDRWPPIHLILTSGLISPNRDNSPPGGKFIQKPYDPKLVIATLRELLGQIPPPDPREHETKAA